MSRSRGFVTVRSPGPVRVGAGERSFRPQMSRGSGGRAPGGRSLMAAVAALVSKQSGRSWARGVSGSAGKNGATLSRKPGWLLQQRVVIKSRVVRNRPGGGGRGGLREHANYVKRDGVDIEGGEGRPFSAGEDVEVDGIDRFVSEASHDRHHFRFIVSPENAKDLDLRAFTEDLMSRAEQDLGTKLQWFAVEHHNTPHPHVHIIVRGIDENGADLVISREYISHGFRERAQEIATRDLGPRKESEIAKAREQDLKADRATRLDRVLLEEANTHEEIVDVRPPGGRVPDYAEQVRLEKITRLHHLEERGLAEEQAPGRWKIAADVVERLTHMARRAQLTAQLHEHVEPSFEFRDIAIYDRAAPDEPIIRGEIVGRGRVDEIAENEYVMVASHAGDTVGNVYRVGVSEIVERDGVLRVGQVVGVSVFKRPAVTNADHNIVTMANQHGGLYSAERHFEAALARNKHLSKPIDDLDAYIERHVKRIEGHERRGLVERVEPGVWRVPLGLKETLLTLAESERDKAGFVQIAPVSGMTLAEQVKGVGPSWLDGQLQAGAHLTTPNPQPSTAERRLRAALMERVEELERRGIAASRRALSGAEIERLYGEEVRAKQLQLEPRYGSSVPPPTIHQGAGTRPVKIEGKLERIEDLASGPHAVVTNTRGFLLVPVGARARAHVGKQVVLTIGAGPAEKDPGRPLAVQNSVRVSERERERDLSRGR